MSINQVDVGRHQELAEFLRNRRARLTPEQLGLPKGTRRRTPGLRREEVAALAGVSLEWYTWLEQGRDINVSVQLLESLVHALQLDETERTHLFLLALRQPPPVKTALPTTVNTSLQDFLNQLGTTPASIIDHRLNIVAWNKALEIAFDIAPTAETASERDLNLIWRIFSYPNKSKGWEKHASMLIALFRAGYARFIDDPWWSEQIAELSQVYPEFRELWARHDVLGALEGRKMLHHPVAGDLTLEYLLLNVADSPDLRFLIYTPTSDTAEKIRQLMEQEITEQLLCPPSKLDNNLNALKASA